jgi:hypothetical protein
MVFTFRSQNQNRLLKLAREARKFAAAGPGYSPMLALLQIVGGDKLIIPFC